jgi:hypothetical protein
MFAGVLEVYLSSLFFSTVGSQKILFRTEEQRSKPGTLAGTVRIFSVINDAKILVVPLFHNNTN